MTADREPGNRSGGPIFYFWNPNEYIIIELLKISMNLITRIIKSRILMREFMGGGALEEDYKIQVTIPWPRGCRVECMDISLSAFSNTFGLSNIIDLGLHRKLWGGFVSIIRYWLVLTSLTQDLITCLDNCRHSLFFSIPLLWKTVQRLVYLTFILGTPS